jgi:hypothetical protein
LPLWRHPAMTAYVVPSSFFLVVSMHLPMKYIAALTGIAKDYKKAVRL